MGWTEARQKRQCKGCGFVFLPHHGGQLYCDTPCGERQATECTQHSLLPEQRFAILQAQGFQCGCCSRPFGMDKELTAADKILPRLRKRADGALWAVCGSCHRTDLALRRTLERAGWPLLHELLECQTYEGSEWTRPGHKSGYAARNYLARFKKASKNKASKRL